MKKIIIPAIVLAFCIRAMAVTVDPAKAVIVVDPQADGVVQFAAKELQKYLALITGTEIPVAGEAVEGRYPFLFGTPEGVTLKPEEARWEVTDRYTRLYGDSTLVGSPRIQPHKILATKTKSGDLTAVYDFLEKQLGVLFLAPGPDGISYEPSGVIELKEGQGNWIPQLEYRFMWPDRAFWAASNFYEEDGSLKKVRKSPAPDEFLPPTRADYLKKELETRLWLKQQRMGEHGAKLNYGHAFTQWWARFGETHPEYFALVDGKRQPKNLTRPDWNKLCVSNPAVWKQIVADWAANKNRSCFINACEDDGYGFCECEECLKLDMPPHPGREWYYDLSDRYVYFANHVLEEARKIDPDAKVCQYAYSFYRYPPRRERVSGANFLIYVPSMLDLDHLEADYKAWHEAGAEHFFLRPNDLHVNISLPLGFEKQIFSSFRIGIENGVIGTSFDSLHGFWDITGIADYIVARGHVDPSRDFEYWMSEYCSAYGSAAPEVRAFFDYFRTHVWEERILPHKEDINRAAALGFFRIGILKEVLSYFREDDFEETEKILRKGLEKELTPQQKRRLETLLLSNEHSRLTFRAMAAADREKKVRAAMELLQFRRKNKDRLNINWERLFSIEISAGDCTGIKAAELLSQYDDFRETPQWWAFQVDPDQRGDAEKWQELPHLPGREMIRTDAPWEQQKYLQDGAFRTMLENYDGIAWYRQELAIPPEWKAKDIFLIFGAVDESAWVYVNGKFAGEHVFTLPDDWKLPFAIPVTDIIDWTREKQTVTVRVEDKSGLGGIWRPVLLAVREKKDSRQEKDEHFQKK